MSRSRSSSKVSVSSSRSSSSHRSIEQSSSLSVQVALSSPSENTVCNIRTYKRLPTDPTVALRFMFYSSGKPADAIAIKKKTTTTHHSVVNEESVTTSARHRQSMSASKYWWVGRKSSARGDDSNNEESHRHITSIRYREYNSPSPPATIGGGRFNDIDGLSNCYESASSWGYAANISNGPSLHGFDRIPGVVYSNRPPMHW